MLPAMKRTVGIIGLLLAAVFAAGCPRKPASSSSSASETKFAPVLTGLPVEMTVKQRTTTAVPGSDDAVRLTVDDITRGQVMVSLTNRDGGVLLGQTSLASGKSAAFRHHGGAYNVTVKELSNALIGEDFATLTISAAAAALSEREKIERLLAHIAVMEGAAFIRNGSEHDAADAASHLRTKWEAADDDGKMTAEQFVERIASKSSLSDEPYRIRLKDGAEVGAGEYLRQQLEAMK
jgi:Family of unknown function (DUF5329)